MIRNAEFVPDPVIEHRAIRLLADFQERSGIIRTPPVPIDQIAEGYLGLIFDWDDIVDTPDEPILGYLEPSTKRVCMNTRRRDHFDRYFGTEAFTKAHEIGHWNMHVFQTGETQLSLPLSTSAEPERYLCRQNSDDKREFQANRFASYLLIPHDMLMSEIRGIGPIAWPDIYDLGRAFAVTPTAMKKRLEGLKLIYVASDKKVYRSEEEYRIHMAGRG